MKDLHLIAALGLVSLCLACGGNDSPSSPSTTLPTAVATPTPTPVPTPTPAPNVAGLWLSQARRWKINLQQRSTGVITGTLEGFGNIQYDPSNPLVQIRGSITASGRVTFEAPAFEFYFEGIAARDGQRMEGTTRDCAVDCKTYGEVYVRR